MLMGADTSGPSSATLSATVSRQTYRLPSAPLSERKVPRSTRFLIADSETPKAAAACRNVSLVSVTVYAPLPRPYAGPFGGYAQALEAILVALEKNTRVVGDGRGQGPYVTGAMGEEAAPLTELWISGNEEGALQAGGGA